MFRYMTIFAHAAVSLLAGKIFHRIRKQRLTPKLFVLYALTGILPDLPLSLVSLLGLFTSETHHHEWITHTPLFWILLSLATGLIQPLIGGAILIGGLSHLATDWYGGGDGIMFLWPVDTHQYGVLLSGVHGRPAFEQYFSNPLFLTLEIILFVFLSIETYKICNTARRLDSKC
ncbi:MAG: metal-dependent hydrolase [Bacteriovoracia bacterium]